MARGDGPTLKNLSAGLFSRGLKVVNLVASAGQSVAKYKALVRKGEREAAQQLLLKILREQVTGMVRHFNQMKGGAMKIGQVLSMYGEVFLPAEVNEILKELQSDSTPFDWSVLEGILMKELGAERFAQLEVETTALASASVGQVHRARIKSTGQSIVLKVQYPDVDRAIDNDLKLLKGVFQILELFPQISHLDLMFEEVATMLRQEVDYGEEARLNREYRSRLGADPRYIVPEVIDEYSTRKVLAMAFEPGMAVDSAEVQELSQERRDRLATNYLELYFNELYSWGLVQTDPHLGNYRVRIQPDGHDKLVLYDFGAVRSFAPEFIAHYKRLVAAAQLRNRDKVISAAYDLDFLRASDAADLKNQFVEFCFAIMEPFQGDPHREWYDEEGRYLWGKSDIPKRLSIMVSQVIQSFDVRVPPREVLFLDRKTGGVFIFLSVLRARTNSRPLLEGFLPLAEVDGTETHHGG